MPELSQRNKPELSQKRALDVGHVENDAEALGRRLREAVEHAGGVAAVVKRSNGRLASRSMHRYLAGETEPGALTIKLIAELTNWSLEWLIKGDGAPILAQTDTSAAARSEVRVLANAPFSTVDVPKLTFKASAGAGSLVADASPDIIGFPSIILEHVGVKPENAALMEGSGDSMIPTIYDGDLLLFDTSLRELRDNKIFVFSVGEECYVKRLRRSRQKIMMVSDNEAVFPPEFLQEGEVFQIFGMVKWTGRSL